MGGAGDERKLTRPRAAEPHHAHICVRASLSDGDSLP